MLTFKSIKSDITADVDECADDTHDCEDGTPNAVGSGEDLVQGTCSNTQSGFVCVCESGYAWDQSEPACRGYPAHIFVENFLK